MLDQNTIYDVLCEVMKSGGDFAEIYIEDKTSLNIIAEAERIERVNRGEEIGAGIRVVAGGNTAYAYTNDLSKEGLMSAARVASRVAASGRGSLPLRIGGVERAALSGVRKGPGDLSFEEKVDMVQRADRKARSLGQEVKQVTVALGEVARRVVIANSLGEMVDQDIVRTRFIVNVVAERAGIIQTGYESAGGTRGWEIMDETPPELMAERAAQRALLMLEARPCPTGRMPVVMSAEAGGTMVHEACGHGLEADAVQKGTSVYKGKVGQKVAAAGVTVIDDGTVPGKNGTFTFDDEGVRAQKNILIDNGVLTGYMYDRLTAAREGRNPTGNGRRESYQSKPIPRMTNTYIAPGQEDPADIIKKTPRGLFVRKMGGGQVNVTTGDFVFEVQEGYIIENGQITYPVRGATLTGNGPRALMDIDLIGNDLGYSLGVCGKAGQGVPVGDAQPTLRIKELVVGGTAVDGPQLSRLRCC